MRAFAQKPKSVLQTKSAESAIPGRAHFVQGGVVNSILHLQRTIGNRAVQRLLAAHTVNVDGDSTTVETSRFNHEFSRVPVHAKVPVAVQTKLMVNTPGDVYEQEAERVADRVMGTPTLHAVSDAPHIQRFSGQSTRQMGAAPASVDRVLARPGRPLEPALRRDMEQRFGHDFSRVRVHSDSGAGQSARDVNAHAYTVGQDIAFGYGQFAPGTQAGQRLLAHELAHTLQQRGGAPAKVARQSIDPRHARGLAGEQGMGFIYYRQQEGWIFFEGPSGSAGHGVTQSGFDGVAYNTRTGEIHLVDNKSLARQGNVGSATAIDPSRNLGKNLDGLIQRVEAAKDVPGRVRLLGRLRALRASLAAGKPLPQDVKLVVTPVGGKSTGVTGRLQSEGVEFRPEPAPKRQPGATTTATKPPTPESLSPPRQGTSVLEPVPETVPSAKGPGVPRVGTSAVRVAVTGIALNVVLFALTHYVNKWYAEKQARQFNSDLKGLLPEINMRLKNKGAEIAEREKAFPLVYGNITIVYTHDKHTPEDYNEGSMSVQDVAISHQNYQTPEKVIKPFSPMEGKDPLHSLTFSVPLFEEQTAETGASSLVRDYRRVRENLTYPAFKVRLSAMITLYKLATQDPSLETLVIRDLLGMLKDGDESVRLSAAVFLSRLKAKIGIQYIREVMQITKNDKQKKLIQRYLGELEQE